MAPPPPPPIGVASAAISLSWAIIVLPILVYLPVFVQSPSVKLPDKVGVQVAQAQLEPERPDVRFAGKTEASASFAAVTASSPNFPVVTAPVANLASVTAPAAKLAASMEPFITESIWLNSASTSDDEIVVDGVKSYKRARVPINQLPPPKGKISTDLTNRAHCK